MRAKSAAVMKQPIHAPAILLIIAAALAVTTVVVHHSVILQMMAIAGSLRKTAPIILIITATA